ncbi:MAG TPA: sulfite exporter TauE/SafE family protein [Burkholderiales bacterium]|nr:sulfite exporter TauE/SafE family protein [Burkholderiales bacterium]
MPFPLDTLVAIPLIGLLAYIILGVSGFGSALVNIPLLAHFLPMPAIVPMIVTVDFAATFATQLRFRREVERAELKLVIPPMIAGILLGVTLLATLPKQATLALLGLFVTGYGLYRLAARATPNTISRWWGIPTGLAGGLVGGLFGVGGPIYAAYVAARVHDPMRMRATLSAIFSVSTGLRLLVFLASGLLLQTEVWYGVALMLPAMFVGLFIGHRLHGRLDRRRLSGFVSLLLVASGLSLLWKAL